MTKGGENNKSGFDAEVIGDNGESEKAGDQGSGDYMSSVFDMFKGSSKKEEAKKVNESADVGSSQMMQKHQTRRLEENQAKRAR